MFLNELLFIFVIVVLLFIFVVVPVMFPFVLVIIFAIAPPYDVAVLVPPVVLEVFVAVALLLSKLLWFMLVVIAVEFVTEAIFKVVWVIPL